MIVYTVVLLYCCMVIKCYHIQVLGTANSDDILVLVWIQKIASASMGAKDSLLILPLVMLY
jgi:hypothetical protein